MATSASRPNPPADPVRQHLVMIRRGLFRLHKALIDAERAVFEQQRGPLSNGQFLQVLIHDPFFAWLGPFTGVIVEIDEALATKEPVPPEQARGFLSRVGELIEPEEGSTADLRYEAVRQSDPDVLVLHIELTQNVAAARALL